MTLGRRVDTLFYRKLARLSIMADSLVDPSICTTADEPNDLVAVKDLDFARVAIIQGRTFRIL